MSQYGEIEDMIVVDNLGDHIVGNVYVKYSEEEFSENAHQNINGRFFNGKKIDAHFSPVTDFLNAKCKQYIDGSCKRGGYCNYMHIKPLSRSFKKELFTQMYLEHPEYRQKKEESDHEDRRYERRRDRDRDRDRRDSRDRRDRYKGRDRERDERNRRRSHSRSRDNKKSNRGKEKDKKKRRS